MAQTGYTPILIYSSSTAAAAPVAGNLTNSTLGSELAINITDGKLFYKDNANAIQVIGWKNVPISTLAGAGTGVLTALGVNVGTAGAFVVNGGALGTPSSGTVTNLTGTASININGTVGATTPNTGSFTSLTDSGNLAFTGTGNRITGDFSNATLTNRVIFQSSTTNGNTGLAAIPNGTGNSTGMRFFNASDITNAAALFVGCGASDAFIQSAITGTGTYLPMTFYTGGSEAMRIDTSRNLVIGASTLSGARLDLVGSINNSLTTFGTADVASQVINNTSGVALNQTSKILFRNGGFNLAGIAGQYTNFNGANDIGGALVLGTQTNAAGGVVERVRIDSSGYSQFSSNNIMPYQGAPTSKAGAATLSGAELVTGILNTTGTTYTITLPTGTNIEGALTWAGNNVCLDWFVINTASGTITIGANGNTTLGSLTIATGTSAHFRIRRTAANTFTVYRLS